MSKKRLVIVLIIVTILGIGGFFIFQHIQNVQRQQAYDESSDKLADNFLRSLQTNDVKVAMQDFSPYLKAEYSENYWQTTLFAELQGFKQWPKLTAKGPVKPLSADVPNRYDPQLNQQATQYEYDFSINNSTYRLMLVIYRLNGQWKINEVSGGYEP